MSVCLNTLEKKVTSEYLQGGLGFKNLDEAKTRKTAYALREIWKLRDFGWEELGMRLKTGRYLHGVTVTKGLTSDWHVNGAGMCYRRSK